MSDRRAPIIVAGIIPAAGRGGRMGARTKAMLEVAGRPMLLGIIDALRAGGVDRVVVVASSEVRSELGRLTAGSNVVANDDPASQMIDSVRIGLDAADRDDVAGFLVCPCDAAGISAADVRRCVDGFAHFPDRVVIATHAGRRGHPMLFPKSLADAVRSAECDAGLNHLARGHAELVIEVACESPGTLANVNTPADYQRLR
jgi:CTP:molybdopterin cytidylyltransferase MocA